jgi:hypothetical protein
MQLHDDHLLMEFEGFAVLEDGSRRPVSVPITVGMARAYKADPNPCRCKDCRRTIIPAVRLLGLQEDFLAGKITRKQLNRELKRMGYVREEKIQRH